jgi:hypothetical protein
MGCWTVSLFAVDDDDDIDNDNDDNDDDDKDESDEHSSVYRCCDAGAARSGFRGGCQCRTEASRLPRSRPRRRSFSITRITLIIIIISIIIVFFYFFFDFIIVIIIIDLVNLIIIISTFHLHAHHHYTCRTGAHQCVSHAPLRVCVRVGGDRGAYQAGSLLAFSTLIPDEIQWDVVTGISAGSINTGGVCMFQVRNRRNTGAHAPHTYTQRASVGRFGGAERPGKGRRGFPCRALG